MTRIHSTHQREITVEDFQHGDDCPCCRHHSRREFLKTGAVITAGLIMPFEWAKAAVRSDRLLRMYNPHTGESIRTVFWTPEHGYILPAIDQITEFMRDFRQNESKQPDTDLLNILHYIQTNVGTNKSIQVNSGYRSPKTNNMLRSRSKKVAKKSYHMKAKAADIEVKGFSPRQLRAMAVQLKAGGVGIYPGSNFIHVDSGPVRTWRY